MSSDVFKDTKEPLSHFSIRVVFFQISKTMRLFAVLITNYHCMEVDCDMRLEDKRREKLISEELEREKDKKPTTIIKEASSPEWKRFQRLAGILHEGREEGWLGGSADGDDKYKNNLTMFVREAIRVRKELENDPGKVQVELRKLLELYGVSCKDPYAATRDYNKLIREIRTITADVFKMPNIQNRSQAENWCKNAFKLDNPIKTEKSVLARQSAYSKAQKGKL